MAGTPENKRDNSELPMGQIPRISAGFIDYLGEQEQTNGARRGINSTS